MLIALLCACAGATAEETEPVHDSTHQTEERLHGEPTVWQTESLETHVVTVSYDLYCLDCGKVIQEQVRQEEKNEPHDWMAVSGQEPTCTQEGIEIRRCDVCGMTEERTLPPVAHQYVGAAALTGKKIGSVEQDGKIIGTVTVVPTCTAEGEGTLFCLLCGEAAQSVSIPALEHDWGEWIEIPVSVDEICITDLKEERVCARCGEKETRVKEAAPGHEWGEWVEIAVPMEEICVTDLKEERICARCEEKETRLVSPAPGHQWEEIENTAPTCTEGGRFVRECSVCHLVETEEFAPLGHAFVHASELIKQPAGQVQGTGEYAGKVIGTVVTPSTCTENGSGFLLCLNCQETDQAVTIPKGDHNWTEWEQPEIPADEICVTDVIATRQCLDCGEEETEVVIPAPGHQWVAVSFTAPTCTEDGRAVRRCAVCEKEEVIETPAQGHYYMWVNSPDGKESEYVCTFCGDVAETRRKEESQMYYNNTITSYGPMTRELIGGSVWNRVTPLDISEEGTFTYPLIASNLYTVGTATVVIENGTQRVTYKLNSKRITVHSESLVIYPDLNSLRTGDKAVAVAFDDPVPLNDYFGEDERVIMAITLKADYDAKAPGIQGFREDQELLKTMRELID